MVYSYTHIMNYKKLKNILLTYYELNTVKHLLASGIRSKKANKKRNKPSYNKALVMEKEHGVPMSAWENIREWLAEQEAKEQQKLKGE